MLCKWYIRFLIILSKWRLFFWSKRFPEIFPINGNVVVAFATWTITRSSNQWIIKINFHEMSTTPIFPWCKYFFAIILFNSFRLRCVLELKGLYNLPYLISLNVSNNQLQHVFSDNSPTAIRVRLFLHQWELS